MLLIARVHDHQWTSDINSLPQLDAVPVRFKPYRKSSHGSSPPPTFGWLRCTSWKVSRAHISLSFHYTGWFIEISRSWNIRIPDILGSMIPSNHQPTEVLNTAYVSYRCLMKRRSPFWIQKVLRNLQLTPFKKDVAVLYVWRWISLYFHAVYYTVCIYKYMYVRIWCIRIYNICINYLYQTIHLRTNGLS